MSTTDPATPPTPRRSTPTTGAVRRRRRRGARLQPGRRCSQTGAPLDLAIEGQGFFQISTADGAALHPRRPLPHRRHRPAGHPGRRPGAGRRRRRSCSTRKKGAGDHRRATATISQAGPRRDRQDRASVNFDSLAALSKDGDNLYRNDSNLTPQPATDAQVAPGHAGGLQRPADRPDHPADRDQPRLRRDRQHDEHDRPTCPTPPSSGSARVDHE